MWVLTHPRQRTVAFRFGGVEKAMGSSMSSYGFRNCAFIRFGILLKQLGDSAMGPEWVHVGSYTHPMQRIVACRFRGVEKRMGPSMASDGFRSGVH